MKLIRFGEIGKEKPGVIINNEYFDVSDVVADYNEDFFSEGGIEKLEKEISGTNLKK